MNTKIKSMVSNAIARQKVAARALERFEKRGEKPTKAQQRSIILSLQNRTLTVEQQAIADQALTKTDEGQYVFPKRESTSAVVQYERKQQQQKEEERYQEYVRAQVAQQQQYREQVRLGTQILERQAARNAPTQERVQVSTGTVTQAPPKSLGLQADIAIQSIGAGTTVIPVAVGAGIVRSGLTFGKEVFYEVPKALVTTAGIAVYQGFKAYKASPIGSSIPPPYVVQKYFFEPSAEKFVQSYAASEFIRENLRRSTYENPEIIFGKVAGQLYAPEAYGFIAGKAKDVYVKFGSEKIAPELEISNEVLYKKDKWPRAKDITSAIKEFKKNTYIEEGKITTEVVTASPQKIKGEKVGAGEHALIGIEDPGIYVTPKGRASPYFLRIEKQREYSAEVSPLEALENASDSSFAIPTITTFKAGRVRQLPREIISKPGWKSIIEYYKEIGPQRDVFITKRSELGLGNVKRQNFYDLTGKYRPERGTTELEAVIPLESKFKQIRPNSFIGKIKGFDKYTTYNGRNIALREAIVLGKEEGILLAKEESLIGGRSIIEGRKIARETEYAYSLKKNTSGSLFGYGSSIPIIRSSKASYSPIRYSTPRYGASSKKYAGGGSRVGRGQRYAKPYVSRIPSVKFDYGNSYTPRRDYTSREGYYYNPPYYNPPTPRRGGGVSPPPPPKRGGSKKGRESESKRNGAYDVYARQGKQFIKVNKKPLTENSAYSRGAYVVDNTSSRSFQVRPSRQAGQPLETNSSYYQNTQYKFRSKKTRSKIPEYPISVEKRKYGIDTQGEVRQITVKGLLALENKRRNRFTIGG